MVDVTILSDWVVYISIISWWNIQRTFKDKHQKKAKQWGVKDVNSTIFDSNGESSGCGGHISYFFPRGLCNSSSEMSQVPCDFTLSLISPAVSLFEQFFWEVTNN